MKFSAKQQELINLVVDHNSNKPLLVFANEEARKEAIDRKFFEILGTDKPDEQDLEDHKSEIFAIIKEVAVQTVAQGDGAEVSAFYNRFVQEKYYARGDKPEIEIKNDSYLTVGKITGNNWNLKRERKDRGEVYTIKTDAYYVGVYEYLLRILTGRASFADVLSEVGVAIKKHKDDFISGKFGVSLNGLPTPYKFSGQYDEPAILEVISRVKAANKGAKITLTGTVEALGRLQGNIVASDKMIDEMNQSGFLGMWKGYECMALPTCYLANTETFAFDPNTIYVLPSDQKLITIANEGNPIVKDTGAVITENMDMTQDYFVIWRMGGVVVFNKMCGKLEILD